MEKGYVPPRAPEGFTLYRAKPEAAATGLASLAGRRVGFEILLAWEPAPGAAPAGFLVERVNEAGNAGQSKPLGPEARSLRCDPVGTLAGSRLYRVSVLSADGSVIEGTAREKLVTWEVGSIIEFLGAGSPGTAKFRVGLVGFDPEDGMRREFAVAPDGAIGGKLDALGEVPALDWNTGFVFRQMRGRRREKLGPVKVPRFGPDGSIVRTDSGETEYVDRELPTSEVVIEAMILRPGVPDDVRWLPETKD